MERRKISLKGLLKKSIKLFIAILYISFVVALSFGSLVAGIFTVIPAEFFGWEVSKASLLGYYSTCGFAPFSTIILFGMTFIGFILLGKLMKYLKRKMNTSEIYLRFKMLTQKA